MASYSRKKRAEKGNYLNLAFSPPFLFSVYSPHPPLFILLFSSFFSVPLPSHRVFFAAAFLPPTTSTYYILHMGEREKATFVLLRTYSGMRLRNCNKGGVIAIFLLPLPPPFSFTYGRGSCKQFFLFPFSVVTQKREFLHSRFRNGVGGGGGGEVKGHVKRAKRF